MALALKLPSPFPFVSLPVPRMDGKTPSACLVLYPEKPRDRTSALLEYVEARREAQPISESPSSPKANSVMESPKRRMVGRIRTFIFIAKGATDFMASVCVQNAIMMVASRFLVCRLSVEKSQAD